MSLAINLGRAFALARRAWNFESLFPVCFLIVLLFFNLTETTMLSRNSLFWILYVVTAVQLGAPRTATARVAAYVPWRRWGAAPQVRALPAVE